MRVPPDPSALCCGAALHRVLLTASPPLPPRAPSGLPPAPGWRANAVSGRLPFDDEEMDELPPTPLSVLNKHRGAEPSSLMSPPPSGTGPGGSRSVVKATPPEGARKGSGGGQLGGARRGGLFSSQVVPCRLGAQVDGVGAGTAAQCQGGQLLQQPQLSFNRRLAHAQAQGGATGAVGAPQAARGPGGSAGAGPSVAARASNPFGRKLAPPRESGGLVGPAQQLPVDQPQAGAPAAAAVSNRHAGAGSGGRAMQVCRGRVGRIGAGGPCRVGHGPCALAVPGPLARALRSCYRAGQRPDWVAGHAPRRRRRRPFKRHASPRT